MRAFVAFAAAHTALAVGAMLADCAGTAIFTARTVNTARTVQAVRATDAVRTVPAVHAMQAVHAVLATGVGLIHNPLQQRLILPLFLVDFPDNTQDLSLRLYIHNVGKTRNPHKPSRTHTARNPCKQRIGITQRSFHTSPRNGYFRTPYIHRIEDIQCTLGTLQKTCIRRNQHNSHIHYNLCILHTQYNENNQSSSHNPSRLRSCYSSRSQRSQRS